MKELIYSCTYIKLMYLHQFVVLTSNCSTVVLTSNGLRLKYVEPGLSNLSICCFDVITESCFSMAFT